MDEPLHETEWNFDELRVPNSEVEVCCFWEYARESAFIRKVREIWRRAADWKLDEKTLPESLAQDWKKMSSALMWAGHGGRVCLFQDKIPCTGGKTISSPFPEAWQSLSPEVRQILLDTAMHTSRKTPPLRWADHFALHVMAESLPIKHVEIDPKVGCLPPFEVMKDPKLLYPKPAMEAGMQEQYLEKKPRTELPSMLWMDGEETLLLAIQWGFTNEEIIKCFRNWVKVHRPKNVKPTNRQGQKTSDWRAALNRLGVMRSLHAYTFADHRLPQRSKQDVEEKDFYRARQEAGKTFRRLFPFVPKREVPIRWSTKGGRRR